MAERMPTELYRCSISDDVKTKDLSFKALEDSVNYELCAVVSGLARIFK